MSSASESSLAVNEISSAGQVRVSLVIPTYKEALNLPKLIERLNAVRTAFSDFEVIIVDDNSQDGTEELVAKLAYPWVQVMVRKSERGLSTAVLAGFTKARFEILAVMDADLSHPPERLPEMVSTLVSPGVDFVVGSRYVKGGQIEEGWGVMRWLNSAISTWLARPFVKISDPMSGFFCLKRSSWQNATDLNPIGYKIGLELIVKGRCQGVKEVPIFFADRYLGESKISAKGAHFKEVVNYLRHIKRLADWKFGLLSYFAQFGVVGLTGTLVNLVALTLFLKLGLAEQVSVGLAILVAMTTNFILNRWITFNDAIATRWLTQYLSFVMSCLLGALVNFYVTLWLMNVHAWWPQLAAVAGVLAGMFFNFVLSRFWVFKKTTGT